MKLPRPFVLLLCCVLFAGRAPAQTKKMRVVSDTAKIYIEPHSSSAEIGTVSKGTILTLFDSGSPEKSWYYISFYSEEKWATLTGFVAASQVEAIGVPTPEPAEKRRVPPVKKVPAKRPPQKSPPIQSPEKKKTETVKASVNTEPEQTAEPKPCSGEVKINGEKPAVRTSAASSGRIMVVAKFGEVLELNGIQGEWYRVKYPQSDGIVLVGFIHQDQIEVLSCVGLEESDFEPEPESPLEDDITKTVKESKIEPMTPVEVDKEPAQLPLEKNKEIPFEFENKDFSVGLNAGYGMPSETWYGGGFAYGAGISYLVTPYLGVELGVFRFRSEVKGADDGLSRGRLSMTPLMISIQGRYPVKDRFVPYAAVGGTFSFNSFELCQVCSDAWEALGTSITESVENVFGWHIGAGLDYHITPSIALNVDVRTHFLISNGTWSMADQLSDVSVSGGLDDLNLNTLVLRFGAKFYFRLF